jgi:deoxycytidylate deaminase
MKNNFEGERYPMFLEEEQLKYYGELVFDIAEKSQAIKRKVGSIIVLLNGINDNQKFYNIWEGFNYNLNDLECCENFKGETFESVVHAEESAIFKYLKDTDERKYEIKSPNHENVYKPIMISSYTPCYNCARLIIQAGIKHLFYVDKHPVNFSFISEETGGISVEDLLKQYLTTVKQIKI